MPAQSFPLRRCLRPVRFAHISDLHVGKRGAYNENAQRLARRLAETAVDRIVLSGDVTNTGSVAEGRLFEKLFAQHLGRMTIVPGNHDRGTDNYARRISRDRVWVHMVPRSQLYFICCDSTQPFNAMTFVANGVLTKQDIDDAVQAARLAPAGHFVAIVLHHHLFDARPDDASEAVGDAFKLPFTAPVDGGRELLARLPSNVQAVLHGHRHQPMARHNVWGGGLSIYNGGSTSELGAFRVFDVEGPRLVSEKWVNV